MKKKHTCRMHIRRLPKWYEETLLTDVSDLAMPVGIRVRTMVTPPIQVEYFWTDYTGQLPLFTLELLRDVKEEVPEVTKESPTQRWWKHRREIDLVCGSPDFVVGPTVVCRIAKDGQPEIVITRRYRDPWLALF